jgi:phosphohistidine phosphatase
VKTLLLLRHAKSSWKHPELADHDRPLKKRGRRDAPRMGRLIVSEGIVPGLILSSTAVRARETAEAVSAVCGEAVQLRLLRDLYHADAEDCAVLLRALPDGEDRVMLVGHNPTMEELLEALTGVRETLPTAALARIELSVETWSELGPNRSARLVRIWRPRELAGP